MIPAKIVLGNALAKNRRSLYLVKWFSDTGGTIQQAGYLVTMCQIKVASKSHSSRPMALPVQGNFMGS